MQGGGSWHQVFLVRFARLAPAPYPILLTDAPPAALLARTPSPIVLKDASVCTLYSHPPYPPMAASLMQVYLRQPEFRHRETVG